MLNHFCSRLQMSLSLCYEEAEVSPPPFLLILLRVGKKKSACERVLNKTSRMQQQAH